MSNLEKLKKRLESYKSKMPTHGKTLAEVVRNYMAPSSYSCRELSKGGDGAGRVCWYGFPPNYGCGRSDRACLSAYDLPNLRCAGAANVIEDEEGAETSSRYDATGYYMREGWDVVTPLVFRLNKGRGFVTGYHLADSGEVVVNSEIHRDLNGAFRAAHYESEKLAEKSRESDEAWRAGESYYENGQTIAESRKRALALIAEIKATRGAINPAGPICKVLRESLQELRGAIRQARIERAGLLEEYIAYKAPNSWGRHMWESFADGACIKCA